MRLFRRLRRLTRHNLTEIKYRGLCWLLGTERGLEIMFRDYEKKYGV